ncbi:GNVR domain-containing protein [Mesorhizobium sp. LHD-90]|uniref:GumC family protein n=1 Tax=Mesorhizobium sp. LHD-90 TaxID=3071414 RepID=UPI0027DFF385|nr:Wzz/FepE/Etk N-terminal domain-containing protein [Mesorhizobium sp. LHD-90]MDQ6436666.1 GNVR domain-containing protein [Mesorhizobium sp. LHD-90]
MLHPDDNDAVERERSLLSLGDSLRVEQAAEQSRLARAIEEVRSGKQVADAATRHRLARSRRSAREASLLNALEDVPEATALQHPHDPAPPREAAEAADRNDDPSAAEPPRPDETEPVRRNASLFADEPEAAEPERSVESPAAAPVEHQEQAEGPAGAPQAAPRPPIYVAPPVQAVAPPVQAIAPEAPSGVWNPLIDPGTVLAGIVRSKWLILATTILGAMLGVLVALNTPKKYESSTELVADPRDLAIGTELTQSGISNEATLAIIENQVRFLTSGTVISKVVQQLNLAEDPEFNGQGPATGLRGLLSPVLSVFRARDGEDDPGRRYALAAMNLGRALSVERGGKTFVISISATTNDPEKSALIANTMTDVFLQSYGELQSDTAGRAASELNSKLSELRDSVEAAERKVESFRAENDLIDAQGRLISDDEILKLNEQLSIARARTLELNARAASTKGVSADAVLAGSLPEEISSPTMQELRAQYSALRGEVDRLAVRLGPRHPQLLALQAQLAGSRGLIDAELKRVVSSIQTDLKRAVQLEQELSSRLAQLKVRQGDVSDKMVTLRELERDANSKRAVYEAFLLRARETGEQQGINNANISVISKAYPPLESNPPSRSTIAMAGMLLGLMAGIGIGGVRGTLDSLRDRAGGRAPRLAWKLRRRPIATMFDQDAGLAADTGDAREPAAGTASTPESVAPLWEAAAPEPVPAYSSASPKDTDMYAPYAPQPGPFDPAQPQAPATSYAHPIYQQPAPAAAGYAQPYYQAYPPQPPHAPPQAYGYPQPMPQQPMPPQPPSYGPSGPGYPSAGYAPQSPHAAPAQPYGYAQPMPQHYHQPPPAGMYPYAPMPQHVQHPVGMQQAPVAPQRPASPAPALADGPDSPVEEIRASLREFRDAIRDLAEQRSRRRYF